MKLLAIILMLSALACAKKPKPKPFKPHLEGCFGPCEPYEIGKQMCFGTYFPLSPSRTFPTVYLTRVILVGRLTMTCVRQRMCWRNTNDCNHGCKYTNLF
jgi:hypothetical protein